MDKLAKTPNLKKKIREEKARRGGGGGETGSKW